MIWLCDSMHGNTVTIEEGHRSRFVPELIREVQDFRRAVSAADGIAGGLHLEATPDPVTECVSGVESRLGVGDAYTTLCDPRLNSAQAVTVVAAWGRTRLMGKQV